MGNGCCSKTLYVKYSKTYIIFSVFSILPLRFLHFYYKFILKQNFFYEIIEKAFILKFNYFANEKSAIPGVNLTFEVILEFCIFD